MSNGSQILAMRRPRTVEPAVFAVIIPTRFLLRADGERMGHPLDYDECLTIRNHTWVGIKPTGERNPPSQIGKFYALPRPGLRQSIIE
jgi:hypothetical protein